MAGHMLVLAGKAADLRIAKEAASATLADGRALQRFRGLVIAQGGDPAYVDDPERLPTASLIREVPSPHSGFLEQIDAREIGLAAAGLGEGRGQKGDRV